MPTLRQYDLLENDKILWNQDRFLGSMTGNGKSSRES